MGKKQDTESTYGVKESKKKNGVVKWILIVVVAMAVIGAIGGGNNDSEKEKDSTQETRREQENTKADNGNESKTEETTEEVVDNIFRVGDVLETKKVKLSYLSCGEYTDENMFVEAGEGKKLIYFEFEFENIGSSDTSVGFFDFDCYADGYEAKNSMCTADNAMTSITSLSPGRKMGGIVVFEVPQNAESIEVEYETSYWTQDKAIFVYE